MGGKEDDVELAYSIPPSLSAMLDEELVLDCNVTLNRAKSEDRHVVTVLVVP